MKAIVAFAIAGAIVLAGCVSLGGPAEYTPVTRNITAWIQAMDWELHPNVSTPVWAFCAEGDGVEPVHGQACGVPGPTIRVMKGDTIQLTFRNTHSIAHTIHFHGWHPFSADMNGADLIQDSMLVQPGAETVVSWIAEPSGSFIYHCHFQTPTHMEMGMYGAFIVEDPEATAPNHEFVAVLDEWAVREENTFHGNMPAYNFFTINGRSFPLTQPWIVQPGSTVRLHLVNAGFEFHAMHLHGYTPNAYEGVAGPRHAVPTDVREIAPGQTIVMDFKASREGVWLFHDHVVPRVTAGSDGTGFGAYPRGMLTVLVVGTEYSKALAGLAPVLVEAAQHDMGPPTGENDESPQSSSSPPSTQLNASSGPHEDVAMKNFVYQKNELQVTPGTTVTWSNQDTVAHTITAEDGSFDSAEVRAGASWSHTFTESGVFAYYCIPHAYQEDGEWKGMTATVIVE